jgi:hypothetical protein
MNEETYGEVEQWGLRTRENFLKNLSRLKIHQTGGLHNSLTVRTVRLGDVIETTFAFKLKGKFVDMGTRKNQPAHSAKAKKSAKKWYTRTLFGRVHGLQGMVSARLVEQTLHSLRDDY